MSQDCLVIRGICGVCFFEIYPQETGERTGVQLRCMHIFHSVCLEGINRTDCPTCIGNTTSEISEKVIKEEYIVITGLGSRQITYP